MADDPAAIQLFSAWLALLLVMLLTRIEIVLIAFDSVAMLSVAFYQDLAVVTVGAVVSVTAVARARRPWLRSTITYSTWTVCLIFGAAAALNVIFFRLIQQPVTLQLIELTDHLRGVWTSLVAAATAKNIARLVLAPVAVLVLGCLLTRYAAMVLRAALQPSLRPIVVAALAIYLIGAHYWATRAGGYVAPMRNPEWAFAKSLIPHGTPFAGVKFPSEYVSDFLPMDKRTYTAAGSGADSFVPASSAHRPLDVVMIVLESVGSRRLGLYGAAYRDTPELQRLARHAVVFDRFYASQPATSAAMAALFCSAYPLLSNQFVTNVAPDIRFASFPALLSARGYRTAFIHEGSLTYDHEGDFLSARGFDQIDSSPANIYTSRDSLLAARLMRWVRKAPSTPFFATLWTLDTHHPYFPPTSMDYGVTDSGLNRYLNAIHGDDALVGAVADALTRAGMADDTLLVVTGDHGEAFGEHGNRTHGFTVYDEETRIPLLIANPKLFANPVRSAVLGQQIDIAPTILGLLGITPPGAWQGTSLLGGARTNRVYLFASNAGDRWGLVDGKLKYIFDGNSPKAEVYDLDADSYERRDLGALPRYFDQTRQARQRLAAWSSFQNKYLEESIHDFGVVASRSAHPNLSPAVEQ
ncbi:MAG: sulfatase [Candidatus Binataceae bacterium]